MGKVININRNEKLTPKKIWDMVEGIVALTRGSKEIDSQQNKKQEVLSFKKEVKKREDKEFIRLVLTETPNFGLREEPTEKPPLKKELSDKERKEICDLIRKNTKSF